MAVKQFSVLYHVGVDSLPLERDSKMSVPKNTGGKGLDLLRNLPRISLANLRPNPGAKKAVSPVILNSDGVCIPLGKVCVLFFK